MRTYKILTLMSMCVFAVVIYAKAQTAPKDKAKPHSNHEMPVIKLKTPHNFKDFVVIPKYNDSIGGPVEIPNALRGRDSITSKPPLSKAPSYP